jgi:hypothetical protein
MPQGWVHPANKVVVSPENPLAFEAEIGANATAASMKPGRVVIYDTNDKDVKEATLGSDAVLGFLDVAPGKLEATAYAVGDDAKVVAGECIAKLLLSGTTVAVVPGDALVCAILGKVKKIAVAVIGSQGTIIGHALETKDPTSADTECLVHFLIQTEAAAAA